MGFNHLQLATTSNLYNEKNIIHPVIILTIWRFD